MKTIVKTLLTLSVNHPAYSFGVDMGRTYARVWKRLGDQDSRSVVGFIHLDTGAAFHAKSWKQPGWPVEALSVGDF
jgi:hypothetical protein